MEPSGAVTSCGVLLLNRHGEILLGHASGAKHWDIPKGVGEPGETPCATALRETCEETGITLDADALLDLGRFRYRPDKNLYLYATLLERIDVSLCVCTSTFEDSHGRIRPEFDAFEWTPFDFIPMRCAKNMTLVLTRSISLDGLLARMLGPDS